MAGDISYGGGGGGGYYPPSFDPNNPMGGGGGYTPPIGGGGNGSQSYAVSQSINVNHLDSIYNSDFFNNNFNSTNPYTPYYDLKSGDIVIRDMNTILSSGNRIEIVGYYASLYGQLTGATEYYPIYRVYNNAYTEFENSATQAQQSYLSNTASQFNKTNEQYKSDLISSYGKIKTPSINSEIQTLSTLKSKVAELEFQDDITKYLNRVTDSSNIDQINDLKRQISELESKLSKELIDYWRREDMLRKKESEFFTWDFSWLTDPYFGRGSGMYLWNAYQQEQRFQNSNMDMVFSGSIYDWLAGGIYLNAAMAGGDLNAAYMPNDYYSIGLQYQVAGTDLNEGMKTLFPYDSMAGGASWGLNSSSRSAYMVLEL